VQEEDKNHILVIRDTTYIWSQVTAVDRAMGYGLDQGGIMFLLPGRTKLFVFSKSSRPFLLFHRYRGFIPRQQNNQSMKMISHLHVARK
jgi:hypothetical protein